MTRPQKPTAVLDLIGNQLESLVARAIFLGIDDFSDLADLVDDAGLAKALRRAASVNPIRGHTLCEDDLVTEMKRRAARVLHRGFSLNHQ